MGLSQYGYMVLIYCLSSVLLVGLTIYAFVCGWLFRRKNSTAEAFITARGQVSMWRVAWSFYAGAVGAWVITGPANYSTYAGVIGMVMYATCSGLPVLMIAYAGGAIQKKKPHVLSMTDFMGWRFGYAVKTYVGLLACFNMCIAMLAEYSAIGTIFNLYVASVAFPIIIVVGVLTTAYTVYGGLIVSVYTDQIQGIASILLFVFVACYLAANFREPLPKPMPCDPTAWCISGTNEAGWGSLWSMPASLFTATVFSEAMWQRAWASSTKRNLRVGAWIGCAGIVIVVFLSGLCGWLAAWGGLLDTDPYPDSNLYLFYALVGAVNANGEVSNWIGVLVVLLAVTMNMSAVDSLQNGLASGISSHLLKGVRHSLAWTRVAVFLVNIPLVVLGTKGYNVLQLFLLANMLCSTSAVPVLLGLLDRLQPYYGGFSMLASCVISFTCTSVFGVDYYYNTGYPDLIGNPDAPYYYDPTRGRNVNDGMYYTWMNNGYNYKFFLVSVFTSLGATMLFIAFNWVWARFASGCALPTLPGFAAPATHPSLFPEEPCAIDTDSDKQDSDKHGSSGQFKVDSPPGSMQPQLAPSS